MFYVFMLCIRDMYFMYEINDDNNNNTACSTVMETRNYQKLSKIDSCIVILTFISQGRDDIFTYGFHHSMHPSSS